MPTPPLHATPTRSAETTVSTRPTHPLRSHQTSRSQHIAQIKRLIGVFPEPQVGACVNTCS